MLVEIIIFILTVGTMLMTTYQLHIYYINIADYGVILSIIFGITGGVLSLMGLIAIFVSLNSQHKIDKCRELYWEMLELPDIIDNKFEQSRLLAKKIRSYGAVHLDKDYFIHTITNVSRWVIVFVCFVWAFFVSLIEVDFFIKVSVLISTTFGIIILLVFHNVLGKLQDILKLGKLPSTEELLDPIKGKEINPISLLKGNSKLKQFNLSNKNDESTYGVLLQTNVPLKNYILEFSELIIDGNNAYVYELNKEIASMNHKPKFSTAFESHEKDKDLLTEWIFNKKRSYDITTFSFLLIMENNNRIKIDEEVGLIVEGHKNIVIRIPKYTKKMELHFIAHAMKEKEDKLHLPSFERSAVGRTSPTISFAMGDRASQKLSYTLEMTDDGELVVHNGKNT